MFKLALNAGHGLYTKGKRCSKNFDINETREWSLNARICDIIEKKLSEYSNIEVLRLDDITGEKDISLSARVKKANDFNANFYLSIHHNAGINGGSGGGLETYVYTKVSNETIKWQEDLYNNLIKHTLLAGNRANGKRKADFYECKKSKMPCVLVECGFMDSKTDVPIILTNDFAEKIANACVEVIVNKMTLSKKGAPQPVLQSNKVSVYNWQKAAAADGFNFSIYGIDGQWGKECENVAKNAVCKVRITYKYKNLTKIIQKTVGAKIDGLFGKDTENFVKAYQARYGLKADGVVGLNTWKSILGV